MKNLLVTGGAGFIGSNFIRFILKNEPGANIVNLDLLTYSGNLENLRNLPDPKRYLFIHGDICNQNSVESLLRDYRIDTIVHFAAETHVDRSINSAGPFIQTNIIGTYTLLEAAREVWLNTRCVPMDQVRFHHISTDEVFGSLQPTDPPFSETTPYVPNSPYAASKAASDHLVRAYGHTYGLPYTISNCSNNYGPYQYPEKLIPLVILNAINGKSLPVYGDGQQIRDWLFVTDHCQAILNILKYSPAGESYNIGGQAAISNLSIIEKICSLLDSLRPNSPYIPHSNLIQHIQDRPGHDRKYAMDITKIKTTLGWEPKTDLEQGLLETIQWYLNHPKWIETIQADPGFEGWISTHYKEKETP